MTRSVWRVATVALIVVGAAGLWSAPANASPLGSPPALPCPPVITCNPAAALAQDAANQAAEAMFGAMVRWVADGAKAVLDRIGSRISETTKIDVTAPWTETSGARMRAVAFALVLPLLLAALIGAVIHQDASRLIRAVAVHLPLAVLGMFAAVQLSSVAVALTDELCAFISSGLGDKTSMGFENVGKAMASLSTPLTPAAGGFLAFVASLLVVIGALLIWLELVLRSAAIHVAVMFLPLTLSGLVWPATARWAKRLVEILVALIVSKFVIVAIINLAVSALAAATTQDALSTGLTGAAILLMAGFAPFALLRLAPIVEAGVVGHLEGMARRPAMASITSTQLIHRMVRNVDMGDSSGGLPVEATGPPTDSVPALAQAVGVPGFTEGLTRQEGLTPEAPHSKGSHADRE